MDIISIVSSQAVLEMSSFSMDTRSKSCSPLVNSLIKNRLFKTTSDIDKPPYQFIHTMDLSVVDKMLHDSPDLVIHRTEIWAVRRPQFRAQESLAFLDASVARSRRGVRCTVLLEHKVVTRHSAYRWHWQQYDVVMTSWSSIEEVRDIIRIPCFVTTMKLPHA